MLRPETEAAVALSSLNGIARWRRRQRYQRKIVGWSGLRIVSEGDSWFQYPFLLKDVIDWLSDPYAVLSLDAAGDLLSDMVQQGELVTAVVEGKPDVVLLSGGENDLLGGSHLSRAVLPFELGRPAAAYLGEAFEANLRAVLGAYERLFARLASVAPRTPVLTHVYDYAIPTDGRWLGKPLALLGIADRALQRGIVRAIVDRFHRALEDLASRFAQVRVIDTRGAVRDDLWYNELHPADAGYKSVAQRFAAAIAEATGTAQPSFADTEATESVPLEVPTEAEQALALLDRFPDDTLLREIGRREALAAARDPLEEEPLAVYPSSLEGVFPELRDLGARTVGQASKVAFQACCAPDGPARAALEQAGRAALVQHLAAALSGKAERPDARALLIATVLVRRLDGLDAESLCRGLAATAAG